MRSTLLATFALQTLAMMGVLDIRTEYVHRGCCTKHGAAQIWADHCILELNDVVVKRNRFLDDYNEAECCGKTTCDLYDCAAGLCVDDVSEYDEMMPGYSATFSAAGPANFQTKTMFNRTHQMDVTLAAGESLTYGRNVPTITTMVEFDYSVDPPLAFMIVDNSDPPPGIGPLPLKTKTVIPKAPTVCGPGNSGSGMSLSMYGSEEQRDEAFVALSAAFSELKKHGTTVLELPITFESGPCVDPDAPLVVPVAASPPSASPMASPPSASPVASSPAASPVASPPSGPRVPIEYKSASGTEIEITFVGEPDDYTPPEGYAVYLGQVVIIWPFEMADQGINPELPICGSLLAEGAPQCFPQDKVDDDGDRVVHLNVVLAHPAIGATSKVTPGVDPLAAAAGFTPHVASVFKDGKYAVAGAMLTGLQPTDPLVPSTFVCAQITDGVGTEC